MPNRQLVDIAVAAKRWRETQRRRLVASRAKRDLREAERATPVFTHNHRLSQQIDAAMTAAKREERKALKPLAKLCDQALPAEDIRTVDEIQALPLIEAGSTA